MTVRARVSSAGCVAVAAALCSSVASCATQYPAEPRGNRVVGTVTYTGAAHRSQAEPQVQVAAFPVFPPQGPPHASLVLERPSFGAGPIPYELRNVPPFAYFVIAELVDAQDPDAPAVPAGAYPNMCYLLSAGSGNVTVSEATATRGVSFALYDRYGGADPCHSGAQPSGPCPAPGRSSIHWQVAAPVGAAGVGDNDALYLFLFTQWPASGPPSYLTSISALDLSLPNESFHNDVTPGEYVAYACLDKGGDHFGRICGDEDLQAFYPQTGTFSAIADQRISLSVNLDTATWAGPEAKDAVDLGCPSP